MTDVYASPAVLLDDVELAKDIIKEYNVINDAHSKAQDELPEGQDTSPKADALTQKLVEKSEELRELAAKTPAVKDLPGYPNIF